MPIYTSEPGRGINQPISNAPSGLGDSLEASFQEGFREGPLISSMRMAEADRLANDPTSEIVNKSEADSVLKQLGVKSVLVPDSGVTRAYLDHVTESRKESLAKQQISSAAPSGLISTPLNFAAGLAGSMADPANLAIGLIPFAGEVRAGSLLRRAGQRFIQGAEMGGLQTAVTIPFTGGAAAAEGDDYTMADAMSNIFLSSLGGGVLHAGGGAIADTVRGRKASATITPENLRDSIPTQQPPPEVANPLTAQSVADDIDNYVYGKAYDDVIPDYRATLQSVIDRPADVVGDITATGSEPITGRNEQGNSLQPRINDDLPLIPEEANQASPQRGVPDAENAIPPSDHNSALTRESAAAELEALNRGEIPEALKRNISVRAEELKQGFNLNQVTSGIQNAAQKINSSHWSVRENAFRAGISHMLQGKTPDLEPVFGMADPQTRDVSFRQIQNGPRTDVEPSIVNASREADVQLNRANRDSSDLMTAKEDLDSELELARNMVDEADSPELRATLDNITKEANDDSILKGLQAYATCMLRRI